MQRQKYPNYKTGLHSTTSYSLKTRLIFDMLCLHCTASHQVKNINILSQHLAVIFTLPLLSIKSGAELQFARCVYHHLSPYCIFIWIKSFTFISYGLDCCTVVISLIIEGYDGQRAITLTLCTFLPYSYIKENMSYDGG